MWTFEHNTVAAPQQQTRQSFVIIPEEDGFTDILIK